MGVYTTDQLDALRAILAKARRYADEDPEVAVMQVRKAARQARSGLGESASPRALQDIDALADEDAPAGLRALEALIDWAASELQGEEVDDFLVDEVDDFLDDGPSAAERYTEAVRHELSSGTLSAEGKQGLSRLRRELGLSADEAKQIFQRAREGSTADSPQAEPSGPPEMTRVEPTTLLSQLFEEETGRRIPMRVSLSAAFELGASPVSPALWSEVMGQGMTSLSFLDAVVFCNRLSELHGLSPPYELLPRFEQARAARDLDAYGQCPPGSVVAWRVYANGYRLPTTAERYARPDLAASAELCYDGAVYPFLEADPSGVVEGTRSSPVTTTAWCWGGTWPPERCDPTSVAPSGCASPGRWRVCRCP
ncbi:MAG TPA: hypothetical protein QGF58_02150 [Myxococcota bacterium]|nr:hypothetical protein [Myxococcota bacterium]